jgi:hypothetical protein
VAKGSIVRNALAFAAPAVRAHHVSFHPHIVDEDQPISGDPALIALPDRPTPRDVAPGLLGRKQRYLKLIPSRRKNSQIALMPAGSPCSDSIDRATRPASARLLDSLIEQPLPMGMKRRA